MDILNYVGRILVTVENADLQHANLRYADLQHANLQYADLQHADLQHANLQHADLQYADLQYADLQYADLQYANLRYANLQYANLRYANLQYANLWYANLRYANLWYADLRYANLQHANLQHADLQHADLQYADLQYAKGLDLLVQARLSILPERGAFLGCKKCRNEVLVWLSIPDTAERSNATGRKCRAAYADVIEVVGASEGISIYDETVRYRVGERVFCDNWESNRWIECGNGIHFYLTEAEARANK